jgi:hypothetical protein
MKTSTLVLLALTAVPSSGLAFTFESAVQQGCHERITRDAARQGAWPDATPPARDDAARALAAAMPFTTGDADAWTVAMMVGVRDVDLRGAMVSEMPELAAIHNATVDQDKHCLREVEDDGAEGDVHALEACRASILSELALALGDADLVDLDATEPVKVGLWTGTRTVELSRYAFHLGRASHTLQDAFSHAFRGDDDHVATIFNYVEPALPGYLAARDGVAHLGAWDGCVDADSKPRVEKATLATAALMNALASPGTRAERLQRADAVLNRWLTLSEGCDEANHWCTPAPAVLGCSQAGGFPLLGLVGLVLLVAGRRRARHATVALLAVALVSTAARAEGVDASRNLHLVVGGSLDRGAGAFGIGGGVALSRRWALSADVEYSPWFDVLTAKASTGTARAYGTVSFAWLLADSLSLRSSVELGASVLLADVPGARAGSVGVVLGLALVGFAWQPSPHVLVEVVPDIMLDVPSLHGVPFVYREYRMVARVGWVF